MTARREFSKRQKAEIVHRAMNAAGRIACEGCGFVLGHRPYEIDHTIAEGKLLGKECCHRGGKTAKDVGDIARAVRREAKHNGIRKPPAFRSKWKKKISGEVVLR
jgi:hypothetical protein